MPVVIVVSIVALALGLVNVGSGQIDSGSAPGTARITVAAPARPRAIPSGFVGLSLEYSAIDAYAGSDPTAVDPVLAQLIRNLTPGQRPVLRIGGDSADWTWWPVAGIARPPGVSYALSQRWLDVTRALAQALGARLVLGLNLEADSAAVAGAEAQALLGGLPSGSVQAFELGNEPELYGLFPWYHTSAGRGVPGRPSNYGFTAFNRDFAQLAAALPGLALAGPTSGGAGFMRNLGQFLASQPRISLATVHRYPLQLCFTPRSSPTYPTIAHLLSPASSTGLADSFAGAVATAHARGLALRADELNSVSCGADPAVSHTFAAALWSLDTLFEMARVGVDGVNIHTYPGAGYELFSLTRQNGRWLGSVAPEYYGLMMFALAAPPGSRLLEVKGTTGSSLKAWATSAPDGRIRVVAINKDTVHTRVLAVRIPTITGPATLERLQAPRISSATGVTLAGQSFGAQTDTGALPGPARGVAVSAFHGRYLVSVPAASAALLTVPGRPG